jgi:tRNA U55 pseudouridine synthase TruB
MSALVRTGIGSYSLESACALDDISLDTLPSLMVPAVTAVAHLPVLELDDDAIEEIRNGRPLENESKSTAERIAAVDKDGRLLAVLAPHRGEFLKPLRNFTTVYQ